VPIVLDAGAWADELAVVRSHSCGTMKTQVTRATRQRPRVCPNLLRRSEMADGTCSIDGCASSVKARGWCELHYQRIRLYGSIAGPPSVLQRFWSNIDRNGTGGCWVWQGEVTNTYGRIFVGGERKRQLVHRFAYEMFVGPIEPGMEIDHVCKVRLCANPDHLDQVTGRENKLRSIGFASANAKKTECIHGHPFDERNTHVTKNGQRKCRACDRDRVRARREQKRAAQPR
jgi:hypothetical protein